MGRKGEGWRGETLVWSEAGRGAGLTHLGSSSPVPVHGRSPSLMIHGGSRASSFVGDCEGRSLPLWSFAWALVVVGIRRHPEVWWGAARCPCVGGCGRSCVSVCARRGRALLAVDGLVVGLVLVYALRTVVVVCG